MRNYKKHLILVIFILQIQFASGNLKSQEFPLTRTEMKVVTLSYLSPGDLKKLLNVSPTCADSFKLHWHSQKTEIRLNEATNQVILSGTEPALQKIVELIKVLDVPPRQIVIEVKIVEIDNEKSKEVGLDWQNLLDKALSIEAEYTKGKIQEQESGTSQSNEPYQRYIKADLNTRIGDFLKLMHASGTGKIVAMPKIVSTNNQKALIFDGKRIKYVAHLSSYADIFETQEIMAGLMLEVTPSIGQSNYLTLKVTAKFTRLEYPSRNNASGISYYDTAHPIESGQILENTIIVQDGESILLGGFKKQETYQSKKKVPILGTILPFLFSKNSEYESTQDILVILQPKVIDSNLPEIPNY